MKLFHKQKSRTFDVTICSINNDFKIFAIYSDKNIRITEEYLSLDEFNAVWDDAIGGRK